MSHLIFTEAQILIYNDRAISKRSNGGALLADLLKEFGKPGFGDAGGILPDSFYALNPTVATPWARNARTVSISGLSFISFLPDGTAQIGASYQQNPTGTQSGYYILPREANLDAKIGSNSADFSGGNTALNWTGVSGTWVTAPPLTVGGGTAIFNRASTSIQVAKTTGTIPANRGHRVDLHLQGAISRTGAPQFVRHFFGDKYCIELRPGLCPSISRVTYPASGPGTLELIRQFKQVEAIRPAGKYRFTIYRVAGRLLIEFNGVVLWLFDGGANGSVKEVSWPAASWQLETQNTRVRAEYSVIKWATAAGAPLTGTLTRTATLAKAPDSGADVVGVCAGWKKKGTTATAAPSFSGTAVSYTLTLSGGTTAGIDTPFVDKVIVRYAPVWSGAGDLHIDVRNCCETLNLSFVAPPDGAGAQGTVVLDRNRLDEIFNGVGGNADWRDFIKIWNPVTILLRRAGTDYSKMFEGYIFKPSISSGLGSQRTISLVLRDPTLRLQKTGEVNHAPIDERYPPLDLLFAQKQSGNGGYDANGNVESGALYIAECVQEILRIALGDDEAARLNGDGDALKFIPDSHPALISTSNDVAGWSNVEAIGTTDAPQPSGEWLAPPPFGSSAYDWIMELARRDRCVFYYGWLGDTSVAPFPIYGRLQSILGAAPVPQHLLPDVAPGDWVRLLQSMESESRPERDVTDVAVWGAEAKGLESILPSMRIGKAALPLSDPRSSIHTWPRTLIIRDPIALFAAESIAQGVIDLLTGVELQWPTFSIEGDERIGLGHLVAPDLTGADADISSGLGGKRFRCERIDHQIDFNSGPGNYRITIYPRPLTAGENDAFERNPQFS